MAARMRLVPSCILSFATLLAISASLPAQDSAKDSGQPPKKAALPKVVMLRPSGIYADLPESEFSPMALLSGGGGGTPKPFFKWLESVEALAKAEGPSVFLDLSGEFQFNLPQLREVERSIAKVRAAGKRIVCYFENADTGTLQIASQCDRVLMADMINGYSRCSLFWLFYYRLNGRSINNWSHH